MQLGMERGKSARGSPSLPAGFYLVEKTPGAGVVMNQFHYVGTRHPEKKTGRTARGRLAVLRALDSSMMERRSLAGAHARRHPAHILARHR